MNFKELAYDLSGYNVTLFNYMHNLIANQTAIKILKFFSDYIGEYSLFPLHFALLFSFAKWHAKKGQIHLSERIKYTRIIFILVCSYCIGAAFIELSKLYFAYPRPYCAISARLNPVLKEILEYKTHKCFKSFPSGHSWYVATFIFSIWGRLNFYYKTIGIALIIFIGTSRVMLGMHFPADVFYGFIIAFIVVVVTAKIINRIFLVYSSQVKMMANYIWNGKTQQ